MIMVFNRAPSSAFHKKEPHTHTYEHEPYQNSPAWGPSSPSTCGSASTPRPWRLVASLRCSASPRCARTHKGEYFLFNSRVLRPRKSYRIEINRPLPIARQTNTHTHHTVNQSIVSPFIAPISRRLGRANTLRLGILLSIIGGLIFSIDRVWAFFLARALQVGWRVCISPS